MLLLMAERWKDGSNCGLRTSAAYVFNLAGQLRAGEQNKTYVSIVNSPKSTIESHPNVIADRKLNAQL